MSEEQRATLDAIVTAIARFWQIGAALVAVGIAWGALQSDLRANSLQTENRLGREAERREELQRRMVENDARHDSRLTAVETRATAAEITLAAIRAQLDAVRQGVDELVRDARARR